MLSLLAQQVATGASSGIPVGWVLGGVVGIVGTLGSVIAMLYKTNQALHKEKYESAMSMLPIIEGIAKSVEEDAKLREKTIQLIPMLAKLIDVGDDIQQLLDRLGGRREIDGPRGEDEADLQEDPGRRRSRPDRG